MAIFRMTGHVNHWKWCGGIEHWHSAGGNRNGTTALEKSLAVFLKNRCVAFTRSSYPLPGACPKEMKTYVHTKNCIQVFE